MRRLLLALARSGPGSRLLRAVLTHFPGAIPLDRVFETSSVIAYRHPAPVYPVHFLLIPKPPVSGLDALPDAAVYIEIVRAAYLLAEQESLPPGWRLAANSGRFQDVGVLHFHLIHID